MTTETAKKASQKDWTPGRVKMELHDAGLTLSGIAEAAGLTTSSSLSVALTRSSPAAEKRIADALGIHPKTIWPSRYFENGERRPQGFRAIQCTAAATVRNVKHLNTEPQGEKHHAHQEQDQNKRSSSRRAA